MDIVTTTKESKDTVNNSKTLIEKTEKLNQKSVGFTQDLELFTNFDNKETIKIIFIYGKR